ncbi:MAG: 2OG-Fe dioxygenase family protein [Vulcanimicrobiota bacterium]
MIVSNQKRRLRSQLEEQGYAALPAAEIELARPAREGLERLAASFSELPQDRHMGDGGSYRFRRFSRFRFDSISGRLDPLADTSIYQSLEDNPLNGGVLRTFEGLRAEVANEPLLRDLIAFDFDNLPASPGLWVVGVHQVRICTHQGRPGKPTPEGIHIDGESFTVQHLVSRSNIEGGVFRTYNQQRDPVFEWLQTQPLDSMFFTGTTLHSASEIHCASPDGPGFRDIFLIDFDPLLA